MATHRASGKITDMTSPPPDPAGLLCRPCLLEGETRRVWTVAEGDATCIRHAVEPAEMDDGEQHELFVVIYENLRRAGHHDAY